MYIKKTILFLLISLTFLPSTSFALRCGNELAMPGDLKHKFLLVCCTPISKETIGYIDKEKDGDRIRVLIIEEWVIQTSGYYYSLVFEGNKLKEIQTTGKVN